LHKRCTSKGLRGGGCVGHAQGGALRSKKGNEECHFAQLGGVA
jgi:hypothetical protein